MSSLAIELRQMQMSGEELAPLARTTYYTLHTIVCVLPLTTYLPLPTEVSGEELACMLASADSTSLTAERLEALL